MIFDVTILPMRTLKNNQCMLTRIYDYHYPWLVRSYHVNRLEIDHWWIIQWFCSLKVISHRFAQLGWFHLLLTFHESTRRGLCQIQQHHYFPINIHVYIDLQHLIFNYIIIGRSHSMDVTLKHPFSMIVAGSRVLEKVSLRNAYY